MSSIAHLLVWQTALSSHNSIPKLSKTLWTITHHQLDNKIDYQLVDNLAASVYDCVTKTLTCEPQADYNTLNLLTLRFNGTINTLFAHHRNTIDQQTMFNLIILNYLLPRCFTRFDQQSITDRMYRHLTSINTHHVQIAPRTIGALIGQCVFSKRNAIFEDLKRDLDCFHHSPDNGTRLSNMRL